MIKIFDPTIKVIVLQKLMLMTSPTINFTRIPPEQEITQPLLDSPSQKTGKETASVQKV